MLDTIVDEGSLDFYGQESDTLHPLVNVESVHAEVNRPDVTCVDIPDPDKPVKDKKH